MSNAELCRRLRGDIDRYWDLAYAEGRENRQHDTKDGDAQACLSSIESAIDSLTARAEKAEAALREARDTNRKMHRRAQIAERTHQMVVDTLSTWHSVLDRKPHNSVYRRMERSSRLLFKWAVRDLKTKACRIDAALSAIGEA